LKGCDSISKKVIDQLISFNSNIYIKNFDNHFEMETFSSKTNFSDSEIDLEDVMPLLIFHESTFDLNRFISVFTNYLR